jgi:hypothetical protein
MTHLVFGQPIRQPVHLHSDGRKRSHLRYPLTARTRNTQANNNFRLPDIDTSTPADSKQTIRGAERDPRLSLYSGLPAPRNSELTRAHQAPFSRHRGGHRPCQSEIKPLGQYRRGGGWALPRTCFVSRRVD